MKKWVMCLAALGLSGAAAAGGIFEKSDVNSLVKDVVALYKEGKGNAMKAGETECWGAFKKGAEDAPYGAMYCSMYTLTGYVVESLASEKEKRKPMAYWGDDAMAERMLNNSKRLGVNESKFLKEIQPELDAQIDTISKALAKTGIGQ